MKNKKMLSLLLVGTIIATSSVTAFAESTGDPYTRTEEFYSGRGMTRVTAIHELTGRYATATGSQTSAYFNNLGYLEQEFAPDYGRTLYINLMDEDFTGGDDLIKEYQGTFEGRRLATIKRTSVKINGAFEVNGDATAELYLNARMTPHYDDDLNFKTRLFRYKLVN